MMRSMFTAISGLKAHQTKMDVIGHNIANVNTVGYKSSRVTFSEFFSQTLSGASGASETTGRGGTNPKQIGLGTSVSSIDVSMTTGAAQTTGNAMDLMINGEGFFIVSDSSGTYFTRAGAFGTDAAGNLINSSGMNVMGWDIVDDTSNPGEYKVVKEKVKGISITGDKTYMTPTTTKNVEFTGNLNAVENADGVTTTMGVYDSLGNRYVVDVKMVFDTATNSWDVQYGDKATVNGDSDNVYEVAVSGSGSDVKFTFGAKADPEEAVTYTSSGNKVEMDAYGLVKSGGSQTITVVPGDSLPADATFGTNADNKIAVDFSELTGFEEKSTATATALDGNSAGTLSNLSIGQDGKIYGQYTNGETKPLFMIPIAQFTNPAGLEKAGSSLFIATANSGEFDGVGVEVAASGGSMLGGTLEMSNVDLSTEFTEMITTQRGFQANSRVITTSDEILQELVNLKR